MPPATSAFADGRHGATRLPSVMVDSYNVALTEEDGALLGDRINKAAFRQLIEEARAPLRAKDADPFGTEPSATIPRREFDRALTSGDERAAGVVHVAIEAFAQQTVRVIRRFLELEAWRDTERIVVGGGFCVSRVGGVAIDRAAVLLRAEGLDVELVPIRHDPDQAGLIGAAHLVSAQDFGGDAAMLGVDIGGTNIRAGIIALNIDKSADLAAAAVLDFELWKHRRQVDDRQQAIDGLIAMLTKQIAQARKQRIKLAPVIGIGCPGEIAADGAILRGAQNLPGDWESAGFNLPAAVATAIPRIDGRATEIVLHNDAVTQGLSQAPFMRDVRRWGCFTVGTGLGNAHFTNRSGR